MSSHFRWLIFVVLLTAAALWIAIPDSSVPDFLLRGGDTVELENCLDRARRNDEEPDCSKYEGSFDYSQGLDLVGGLRVLLRAELPEDAYTTDALQETANRVSRRVNAFGLSEATVQLQGSSRILVEIPGVSDPQKVMDIIRQTALLEFVDFSGMRDDQYRALVGQYILTDEQLEIDAQRQTILDENPEATAEASQTEDGTGTDDNEITEIVERYVHPNTNEPFVTIMTGGGLQAAVAQYDTQNQQWLISFEIQSNEEGDKFGPYTATNIGNPMAIVLDGLVLSAPTIQAELATGGVITGSFTEEEAKTLALQLRSGALPIPLSVESAEQVGATLGQESVELSVRAGIAGVIVVLSFMMIYYRVPGIAADMALLVFIVLNIALFKLIPITLTLPALTGFLISVGTAVDGNILIFERLKEELRSGKSLTASVDAGFDRAWTSIRDSNISTIIICGVLFFFGQTPGASIVSGFAITLALGLMLNLFTAVLVTRTFLYVIMTFFHDVIDKRRWLLGV
jgi:protein-export membrane protein SecD